MVYQNQAPTKTNTKVKTNTSTKVLAWINYHGGGFGENAPGVKWSSVREMLTTKKKHNGQYINYPPSGYLRWLLARGHIENASVNGRNKRGQYRITESGARFLKYINRE